MRAFFWQGPPPNFGDLLAPHLLRHFGRKLVAWAPPEEAEIVTVGSVLDVLPPSGWNGIVAGSGTLKRTTEPDLRGAIVLGLRGHLTAANVKMHRRDYVLGDPGLLASELIAPESESYPLAVIPHWSDTELYPREVAKARRYGYAIPRLVGAAQDPLRVIAAIGAAKKVITSSLHGAVTADSFGIPRRCEPFPNMNSPHEGGRHKWDDYASVLGQPIEFGTLQSPNRERVELVKTQLFQMYERLQRIA